MSLMRESLLRKVLSCGDLPTLPQVVELIVETAEDDAASARDLTRILEADPTITARILRLANSSFYGLARPVETVQRAVVTIGFEAVKELALATTVVDCVQRARQSVLEAADFWMHSFGAGKAAQLLAISSGRADAAPLCFTAGILHDLGKLLLAITLGAEYRQHTRYARQLGLRLCDVEQREYGIDHAEIGEAFLRHWRVPGTICDCVKYQYVPAAYPGEHRLEVAIVSASSEISRLCQFGNGGDEGPLRLPPFHDLACGPSAEALTETIAALPPFRAEAKELLNVLHPTE